MNGKLGGVSELAEVAPAFVEMAHRIVWASVATVDRKDRPRSRVLHPLWDWDGASLGGWIATGPSPVKVHHLERSPFVSINYWAPNHDTCVAECRATWSFDDETRQQVWEAFKNASAPVGYDPAVIPVWKDGPITPTFAALRVEPWRLRVMPGTAMLTGQGETLTWSE